MHALSVLSHAAQLGLPLTESVVPQEECLSSSLSMFGIRGLRKVGLPFVVLGILITL